MELKNDLLLRAARGEKTERTPVWLMRQAGRILKEYRAVRAQAGGFKEMVGSPELACEVTIQPVDILDVDAAIIFSDILVVPEAMGIPYKIEESKGPWFEKTIRNKKDLEQVRVADPSELSYVTDAIKLTKTQLNGRVPLIGFAGAPWTIFAYVTEGKGSKTFSVPRSLLYSDPEFSDMLLSRITDTTIGYLKAQIDAGADIIQIFDSWAGILGPEQYAKFSLTYISKICDALAAYSPKTPVTVFPKGAFFALEELGKLNCRTIGLDWNMRIKESRAAVGKDKTLQGNLDPCVLFADKATIKAETEKMLNAFGPDKHIANLGHGVYPETDADMVKYFIETVKSHQFNG